MGSVETILRPSQRKLVTWKTPAFPSESMRRGRGGIDAKGESNQKQVEMKKRQ